MGLKGYAFRSPGLFVIRPSVLIASAPGRWSSEPWSKKGDKKVLHERHKCLHRRLTSHGSLPRIVRRAQIVEVLLSIGETGCGGC